MFRSSRMLEHHSQRLRCLGLQYPMSVLARMLLNFESCRSPEFPPKHISNNVFMFSGRRSSLKKHKGLNPQPKTQNSASVGANSLWFSKTCAALLYCMTLSKPQNKNSRTHTDAQLKTAIYAWKLIWVGTGRERWHATQRRSKTCCSTS